MSNEHCLRTVDVDDEKNSEEHVHILIKNEDEVNDIEKIPMDNNGGVQHLETTIKNNESVDLEKENIDYNDRQTNESIQNIGTKLKNDVSVDQEKATEGGHGGEVTNHCDGDECLV